MKIKDLMYGTKIYWLWKHKLYRLMFLRRKISFSFSRQIVNESNKNISLIYFIKSTAWSVLKAISTILLLYTVEYTSDIIWINYHFIFPKWVVTIQSFIPIPHYPEDKEAVIELLSVIASVTGVIIALFYPIIATIASTAYAKVHSNIRNLLLSEEQTQFYLRRLTFLTSTSLTTLLLISLHIYPGNLILIYLFLYSLVSLYSLLRIGFGVYNFFEPSTLNGIVVREASLAIKNSTIYGEYWYDHSFQSHYHKTAKEQLENLNVILSITLKDDDIKESAFNSCLLAHISLLKLYIESKESIPIESLWFPKIFNHKSFFESDITIREVFRAENSFIRPDSKMNYIWFEEKIFSNLLIAWESVSKRRNLRLLSSSLPLTNELIVHLGYRIDTQLANTLFDNLQSSILFICQRDGHDKIISYTDWKYEMITLESYCIAVSRFQHELFRRIIEFDSSKLNLEFSKINWKSRETIYKTDFPPFLFEILNSYYEKISNEIYIHNKKITPDWYIKQHITSVYLENISTSIFENMKLTSGYVLSLAEKFNEHNNALLCSLISHIGIHSIHRIKSNLITLQNVIVDLNQLEICKDEYKWCNPDIEKANKLLLEYKTRFSKIITSHISTLSQIHWDNQFPDIYGQSYSFLTNEINRCFDTDNLGYFKSLFPVLLQTVLKSKKNITEIAKKYNNPLNITYQIYIDIMQISGYAAVYSELYKNDDYWNCVVESWDSSFLSTEHNIKFFVSYYNYYKTQIFTGINFTETNQRELTLSGVAKKLSVDRLRMKNKLISKFIPEGHYGMSYDPAELFIELYLFTFVDAKSSTELFNRKLLKYFSND